MSQVIASLMAVIGADTAPFDKGAKKVKGGLSDLGKTFSSVLPAGTAQFLTLGGAIAWVGTSMMDALKGQIAYANNVREIAMISQTSTEEASRFIQVLDDYKLTTADATAATRAMKEQGLVPTIDTLARLSDAFLAIQDPAERMKFVQENLGRGGTKWIEILNKGSAALRAQGDGISKSLILTQKMVDESRKAEMAMDQWGDAVTGLKTAFAVQLLPSLTAVLNKENDLIRARQLAKEAGLNVFLTTEKQAQYYIKLAQAEREATEAMMLQTGAMDENTISAEENARVTKEITDINTGMLGVIGDLQGATENYESTAKQLADERIQIENDRATAISQGWWENSEKVKEYDLALAENTQQTIDNKDEFARANLEIISGLVERKLMQDGVLTDEEFNWLLEKRLAWGLYTEDVVAKAQAAWKEADRITESINAIPTSKTTTIDVISSMTGTSGGGGTPKNAHATGGDFLIPMSYGNEGFRLGNGDTASGGERVSITPRGGNSDVIAAIERNRVSEERLVQLFENAVLRVVR